MKNRKITLRGSELLVIEDLSLRDLLKFIPRNLVTFHKKRGVTRRLILRGKNGFHWRCYIIKGICETPEFIGTKYLPPIPLKVVDTQRKTALQKLRTKIALDNLRSKKL